MSSRLRSMNWVNWVTSREAGWINIFCTFQTSGCCWRNWILISCLIRMASLITGWTLLLLTLLHGTLQRQYRIGKHAYPLRVSDHKVIFKLKSYQINRLIEAGKAAALTQQKRAKAGHGRMDLARAVMHFGQPRVLLMESMCHFGQMGNLSVWAGSQSGMDLRRYRVSLRNGGFCWRLFPNAFFRDDFSGD